MVFRLRPLERNRCSGEKLQSRAMCKKETAMAGGPHSTMDSVLASHPAAPGSILRVPEIFLIISDSMLQRFNDRPAQNSGQRLDDV